jgi:hypothetical protein
LRFWFFFWFERREPASAGFRFTRCCGGLFATTETARLKRSQASGSNSTSRVSTRLIEDGMTKNPVPFYGPKLKIERAKRHISDLNTLSESFFKRKPYQVVREGEFEGKVRRIVRVHEHIPEEFPLLIGDAVHNLRASLDILACDLVRLNGGNVKNVYFPFCEIPADYELMIKKRHLDRASPDIVDLFRTFRPYPGGDDSLRGIHDLDVADKHQLIIPVIGTALQPSLHLDFTRGHYVMRSIPDAIVAVEDGTELDPDMDPFLRAQIDDDRFTFFRVCFANGQPFAGENVVSTLENLHKITSSIVDVFETHCFGKKPAP